MATDEAFLEDLQKEYEKCVELRDKYARTSAQMLQTIRQVEMRIARTKEGTDGRIPDPVLPA
jgi:hypothetical protein